MIGIFDSGIGGLAVVGRGERRLPDIIYFSDTVHALVEQSPQVTCTYALNLLKINQRNRIMACNYELCRHQPLTN